MFVPETSGLEQIGVLLFIDLLEDVLESSIVLLENGVLSSKVEWELSLKSELE